MWRLWREGYWRMRATEIEELINTATENQPEHPRNYLGISSWGDPCQRRMWYRCHGTPGKKRIARFHNIGAMGNAGEEIVKDMLERAGFHVTGQQLAVDDYDHKLGGHLDGVLEEGPADLTYPCLWECKFKGDRYWKAINKNGVEEAEPLYWVQMHGYMAYMNMTQALFTAVNRNTGELYCEVVDLNLELVEKYQKRAVMAVDASSPDEMSRIANDENNWQCKFCDYRETCYEVQ